MNRPPGGRWIRRYYLLTPLFIVLDVLFGLNVRVSGLASPELRYLYYGLCLLCALACYWQSRYSALIAIAESSVNLLILLAGVMIPIVHLGDLAGDAAANAGISGYNVINFLLSGGILLSVFYSAQDELRNPPGTY
jgi:heme A synthase